MQILGLAQIEAPKQISWGFDSYACDRLSEPLAEVSFIAGSSGAKSVDIDAAYVEAALGEVAGNEDLSRYVL